MTQSTVCVLGDTRCTQLRHTNELQIEVNIGEKFITKSKRRVDAIKTLAQQGVIHHVGLTRGRCGDARAT